MLQKNKLPHTHTHTHTPFHINNENDHTMGKSLFTYIEMKMHEIIDEEYNNYDTIIVQGKYNRNDSIISSKEKRDKLFNFQRPTAVLKENVLFINCYPSVDYVKHYGSLIKSYIKLKYPDNKISVECLIPSEKDCWKPLEDSNIFFSPKGKLAIIGYGLESFSESNWVGTGPFAFNKIKTQNYDAILIGCQHSIWGDAGGRVVYQLGKIGFEKVIYIGKLGTMDYKYTPNKYLSTGDKSYLEGNIIQWKNIFNSIEDDCLIKGIHYTCPSVIYETIDWLGEVKGKYDFVDPEIGMMAKYAEEAGVQFSYLHIISDNLVKKFDEDLSNERKPEVIIKRKKLLKDKIINILKKL